MSFTDSSITVKDDI